MKKQKNPFIYLSLILLAGVLIVLNTIEFTDQQYTEMTYQLIINAILQVILIIGVTLYNRNKDNWEQYFSKANFRLNSTLIPLTVLIYFMSTTFTPIIIITQITISTIQIFMAIDTIRTIKQSNALMKYYQEKYKTLERTSTK